MLGEETCLVIPPYQRAYEWNQDRWHGLIRDIVEGLTTSRSSHFMGVAITSESKPDCARAKSPVLHKHIDIIDGQQRLLTLRIWLQAILDHSKDQDTEINQSFTHVYCQETDLSDWNDVHSGNWVSKYRNYKSDESGLLHAYTYFRFVLWLGQDSMIAPEPESLPKVAKLQVPPSNIEELHTFWSDSLAKRAHSANQQDNNLQLVRSEQITTNLLLKATVDELSLLVLEVTNQDEDPADIFNALNGQRTELQQFDHLRNFVFANINSEVDRHSLYQNTWKDIERQVINYKIPVKGSSALDTFLYDLLISLGERRHQQISKDKTARQFNRYFNSTRNTDNRNAKEVAENLVLPNLISWTSVKRNGLPIAMNGKTYELPTSVKTALISMEWMSSGPVIPLLLNIVNRYHFENLSENDLIFAISAIESHLARFIISGEPLSPLRAGIMSICGQLGQNYSIDQLEELLRADKPNDRDLKKKLLRSTSKTDPYSDYGQLYKSRTAKQLLAILQGIERGRTGEHCVNLLRESAKDQLTIEHIYPQTPEKWKGDLRDWNLTRVYLDKRLHTLGNLAVVPKSINSQMSNESFSEKKNILKKNKFSKLAVNSEWQSSSIREWTPEKIDSRAESLLEDFLKYYPF